MEVLLGRIRFAKPTITVFHHLGLSTVRVWLEMVLCFGLCEEVSFISLLLLC